MEEKKYNEEDMYNEIIDPFEDFEEDEVTTYEQIEEFANSIGEDFLRYGVIMATKKEGFRDIWMIQTEENFLEMRVLQTKEILLKAKTSRELYETKENPFKGLRVITAEIEAPIDNNKLMLIPYLSMMGVPTSIEPMPQKPRSHHKK